MIIKVELLHSKESKMNKYSITSIVLMTVMVAILLPSCGSKSATATTVPVSSGTGGASDGQALMQERCSVCHSTSRITSAHKTADQWASTVERMISHGAQLDSQEQQTLVDYLAQTYP
jgi:hypothetical protein